MQDDLIILLEWFNANGIEELFNNEISTSESVIQALAKQQNYIKYTNGIVDTPLVQDYADHLNNLDSVVDFVKNSDIYNKFRKTASNSVIFDGDLDSDIIIVNDIPNDADDINGKIFSEEDGILLKNMMQSININKYFLLNSFFWRLPGNRNPIKDELDMCKPLVEKIIFLMKPKLIILTGNYSTYSLLGNGTTLLNIRGKILNYTNQYLLDATNVTGLYSPSFIVKNTTKKQDIWNNLLTIKSFLY